MQLGIPEGLTRFIGAAQLRPVRSTCLGHVVEHSILMQICALLVRAKECCTLSASCILLCQ